MLAIHGTSAHLRAKIATEGLRQPRPGRGIFFAEAAHFDWALGVGMIACFAHRRRQQGEWRQTKALIVTCELMGLQAYAVDCYSSATETWAPTLHVTSDVGRWRIRGLEEIAVELPSRYHRLGRETPLGLTPGDTADSGQNLAASAAVGALVRL